MRLRLLRIWVLQHLLIWLIWLILTDRNLELWYFWYSWDLHAALTVTLWSSLHQLSSLLQACICLSFHILILFSISLILLLLLLFTLSYLHFSVLFLHLLHHFLNSESLSLVFALNLALYLLLEVSWVDHSSVCRCLLFKLWESLPELLEVGILNKFLTFS